MPDSDRPLNGLSHSDKIATGPSVHMHVFKQLSLKQTSLLHFPSNRLYTCFIKLEDVF